MSKPYRFGVMCAQGGTAKAVKEQAKLVEDLGYYSILYNDHYAGPGPAMDGAHHPAQGVAAIPAVTLAADATSTLRVGFRVLCADYHNPVVLAKELATMDVFSEGRLEIGIGAGWITNEYEAMGVKWDKPSERIARLEDYVHILKGCFSGQQVNVDSAHGVHASGFSGVPLPVQRPWPPFAIGGGGKKILQLAGREADIVAFNLNNRAGALGPDGLVLSTAEGTRQKLAWVKEGAGERLDDITLEIGAYFSAVTDDRDAILPGMAEMLACSPEDALEHPHALIGSVDQIVDTIEQRREEYGFSYITILEGLVEPFAPVVARLSGK
jgi:probable F420-dependent oxidoreductase